MAASLFAVVQKAQEAIMWLAAMANCLGGFCVLISLILWRKGWHIATALVFLVGLFTTESLLFLMLLVPLTDAWVFGKFRWRPQYLFLVGPALVFLVVFLATLPTHHMVNQRLYAFGWHALLVFAKSSFRLAFPSLFIAGVVLSITERRLLLREVAWGVTWMCVTLLPFIFLTYQNQVPSRHNYVPVMGLALALSGLLATTRRRWLVRAFIAVFVVANVSYVWLRKDSQFELRARPTTLLLEELKNRPPERILVVDFPLNPWMAKMTARHAKGWEPHMIEVNAPTECCPFCPRFQWNEQGGEYRFFAGRGFDAMPSRGY